MPGTMMGWMFWNRGDAWEDDGGDVLEQEGRLGGRWGGCSETGGMVGRMMVMMFWNRWYVLGDVGEDVLGQR